jgi:RNA polymerase sigma-70 factor (ECF subfamily)
MDLEGTARQVAPDLLRYCIGASGEPSAGEDIAQEALAALVRFWRRNGPPESPTGFVYTVARRQLTRWRWRRRLLVPLDMLGDNHSSAEDLETTVGARRRLEDTLEALKELSPRDREAILLSAAGDLPGCEAARVLGVSLSAFKMRVHRARERLCRHLEDRR